MKKILSILLSCFTALSLFACAHNELPQEPEQYEQYRGYGMLYEAYIQDNDGVDKCFWEAKEGEKGLFAHYYDDWCNDLIPKHADLYLHAEYDLFIEITHSNSGSGSYSDYIVGPSNYFWPVECEYNESKIEITSNPDKVDHFILKVLQPFENEKIIFRIADHTPEDGVFEGKNPLPLWTDYLTITVSAFPPTVID